MTSTFRSHARSRAPSLILCPSDDTARLDRWGVSDMLPPMSDSVQYLTDDQGERTAVLLPIAAYEKLLEDLDDLAVVAERREEPTIPHEQFVAELKRDGIL